MPIQPTHVLTLREQVRIHFVLSALNDEFNWMLPDVGTIIPIGPIGGHYNVHFSVDCDPAPIKAILGQPGDHAIPPGYRFARKIGDYIWSLHCPDVLCAATNVSGIAHIDRGDPNRDVAGLFVHTFYDGLWGHLHLEGNPRDLDPK